MAHENTAPGDTARRVIRAADRAVLATALADGGWPYASLAMVACDHAANPLLLLSDLAEHTTNIAADSRASLLFDGTAGLDNPLTGARVTVLGRLAPCDDATALARYIRRHPDAEAYLDFTDFRLYRMAVERAHLVAGFGEIHWIEASGLLFGTAQDGALAGQEAGIVAHMNEDHGDALTLYAERLLGLAGAGWSMTGIDPEGCDLRRTGAGARSAFDRPVDDSGAARAALVDLVKRARDTAG